MTPYSGEYLGQINRNNVTWINKHLKVIISHNPKDLMALTRIADVLSSASEGLGGLAISVAILERWPESYMSWWSLASTLRKYAGELRGNDYWVDVPDRGKIMSPILQKIAYVAINQAIEMNPQSYSMHVQKMQIIIRSRNSRQEFMETFHEAVKISPKRMGAYSTGLYYTLPRWRSTFEEHKEIWETAKKPNSEEKWFQDILKRFNSDPLYSYNRKKL